jgi:carbonic anhydrase
MSKSTNVSFHHGSVFVYSDDQLPQIRAVLQPKNSPAIVYPFHGVHFHWECSEHTIDGKHFALEAHFVHYNERHGDLNTAMSQENGLFVLGVLFEESDNDNEAIDSFLDFVRSQPVCIRWSDLFPNRSADFVSVYHYTDSMTRKSTCPNIVTWNLPTSLNHVSRRQIEEFQKLHSPSVTNNCAAAEPLNSTNDVQVYQIRGSSASSKLSRIMAGNSEYSGNVVDKASAASRNFVFVVSLSALGRMAVIYYFVLLSMYKKCT